MEFNYDLISREWDAVADERYQDLKEGKDKSFSNVLKPALLRGIKDVNLENVLDVGCGVGILTEEVANYATKITAIDISKKSIEIANLYSNTDKILYLHANVIGLEGYSSFTTVISNMTLMTTPDVAKVIQSIKGLMANGASFIFTITHPSFWPLYWGYASEDFDYNKEVAIETTFRTRFKNYNFNTHHFHRPLSHYINSLVKNGFKILNMEELKGDSEKQWYPRFLLFHCKLLSA